MLLDYPIIVIAYLFILYLFDFKEQILIYMIFYQTSH